MIKINFTLAVRYEYSVSIRHTDIFVIRLLCSHSGYVNTSNKIDKPYNIRRLAYRLSKIY